MKNDPLFHQLQQSSFLALLLLVSNPSTFLPAVAIAVVDTAGNSVIEPATTAEAKCRQAHLDYEYETKFDERCQCVPDDDSTAWRLLCDFDCEMCLDTTTCVIMTQEDWYYDDDDGNQQDGTSTMSRTCLYDFGANSSSSTHDKFCFVFQSSLLTYESYIDDRKCAGATMCPEKHGEKGGLWSLHCHNLGLTHDTCTAKGMEQIRRSIGGPLYFFIRLFMEESEEEPTVGTCYSSDDHHKKKQLLPHVGLSDRYEASNKTTQPPCRSAQNEATSQWSSCVEQQQCSVEDLHTLKTCMQGLVGAFPPLWTQCSRTMPPICRQLQERPACAACAACRQEYIEMIRCDVVEKLPFADFGKICSWDCVVLDGEQNLLESAAASATHQQTA